MTQSDYPIYTLDAIHEDICFLVSYFFYDTRKKKEYSLAEVSKKTGIYFVFCSRIGMKLYMIKLDIRQS